MNESNESPAPRSPQAKRWLAVIVAALLTAFATVAAVQWRQYTLLNDTVRYEGDNIVWSFFQLEAEYLKLLAALREVERDPSRLDRDALQLRYDLFVSRIDLVEPPRTQRHMTTQPIQTDTVAQVHAFVDVADQLLGADGTRPIDAAAVHSMLMPLQALGKPVHDMAMWANDTMATQIGLRNDAVRQQNLISLALTIFQSLLTIVFAAIVVRQLRALEQRGRVLERLAARLQDARHDAETASRTKGAFLANMSHELRTPFQGVLGMLALLKDSPLNAQQADQLRTATESAHHLLALLNDVLDLSTLENGHLRLVPQPTALHRLLDEVQALMAGPAHAKGLVLRVARGADLPERVEADPTRLKQILFNLLGNAVKFTAHGAVVLEVGVDGGSAECPLLRFTVIDTGVGMDTATVDRLFQRFAQGDEGTSRRFGGTGLGLEISRSLARMMGGDIEVASQPGLGSRFSFHVALPRSQTPPLAADAPNDTVFDTPPLRVLVADDHPVNRQYLQTLLSRLGHEVTLCEHGQAAVETVTQQDFDLVLMDLHMPVMDGFEAARRIRALPPSRGQLTIVALTADAFRETRERAAAIGMNAFLPKPVQPVELQQCLGRLFGRPSGEPGSAAPDRRWLDPSTPEVLFGELPPELHASLLNSFFDDGHGSIAELLSRLNAAADESTRDAAHGVKGVALSLGLSRIAEAAETIETAPIESLRAQADELRERLQAALSGSRAACVEAGWLTAPLAKSAP